MSPSPDHSATVTALTIAGSDPSGGAGIQADMKAMSALGAYAMSVITALTAQSTRGVTGVHAVPIDFVRLQLDTLLDDIVPDATKIGMLATAELADAVGEYLPGLARTVLDPVMVATSGDRLLDEEAVGAVEARYGVPISVVTVSDTSAGAGELALVAALGEAAQNAVKHGEPPVSVYMEVRPDRIEAYVKDNGPGFDMGAVADDRHGVKDSIIGRMARAGGAARIRRRTPGTEVELIVPRSDTLGGTPD